METRYLIKLSRNTAKFIWGSTPQTPLKSSIDLEVRIDPKELLILAKKFKTPVGKNEILVQNLEVYNRLLIYACVRPSLRGDRNIQKLEEQILGMTSWDAHYWASAFRELWWKHGKRIELQISSRRLNSFLK
ncbi:MAG: hypothetical protein RMI85_04245 [Candidatus Korarchaeum sp.]|nr:hypothetical protein [Candidatus Korarchaeum sp.]